MSPGGQVQRPETQRSWCRGPSGWRSALLQLENCWRRCHICRWQCWSPVTCACVTAGAGVTYSTTELCHITERDRSVRGGQRIVRRRDHTVSAAIGASTMFCTICKPLNVDCLFHNLRLWIQHDLHDREIDHLTMCCQLSSPRPAPVEPARPAQQGHRPLCGCTATVESTSSSRRLDLKSASATQQGCRRIRR